MAIMASRNGIRKYLKCYELSKSSLVASRSTVELEPGLEVARTLRRGGLSVGCVACGMYGHGPLAFWHLLDEIRPEHVQSSASCLRRERKLP